MLVAYSNGLGQVTTIEPAPPGPNEPRWGGPSTSCPPGYTLTDGRCIPPVAPPDAAIPGTHNWYVAGATPADAQRLGIDWDPNSVGFFFDQNPVLNTPIRYRTAACPPGTAMTRCGSDACCQPVAASGTGSDATPSNTTAYVAAAVGGLVLVGLGFMVFRKKKPVTA